MLYERWREVAGSRQDELALRDLPSGQQWTFRELDRAAGQGDALSSGPAFPQGIGPEFVLTVLRAWRADKVVCPLEAGQSPPIGGGADRLPPGTVHLKTTSATTGLPRLIAFTAEQLAADAENVVATMGLNPGSPNLGVISLAHSYGFSNLVLPLLLQGVPLLLVGAPLPEIVRRAAAASPPDLTLAAVPALWRTWHEADAIPRTVRLAISAGAPLPLALEEAVFRANGLKLHNFYGSSECGGIAFDASETPRSDAACAGTPMRNVELSVAADGCLAVRSRAVAQTYWPEPDSKLSDGVFSTTDLAEIANGQVYLRGRLSDQINVAGRKVSPETIERVLLSHPVVRECVVFGIPANGGERGEAVVACVAVNGPATGELLKQYLLTQLPAWQVPREWWFVEALGANHRGKLSRAEWRRRFLER